MVSEGEFLLHAMLMGVFITFVYDLLRIFRRVVPHGSFLVSLEDLVFWIYCGAEVFLLMYHESNGTFRWFSILGAMTGILTYKKLVSSLFVKYVSLALTKILKMLAGVMKWLLRPFGFLRRKAGDLRRRVGSRIRCRAGKIKRAIKNRLTVSRKMFRINRKK